MHSLIVGNSYSGKTKLAQALAAQARVRNHPVIVCDPKRSQGWPGDAVKFASPQIFLRNIDNVQNAIVFVDEAKTLWDFDDKEADKLVYQRRHQGLYIVLIAQRTRMVAPNGRNQCSKIYAFRQQKDDADILASEYHEGLFDCRNLQPCEFLASDGYKLWRGRLQFGRGPVPSIAWNNPSEGVDTSE